MKKFILGIALVSSSFSLCLAADAEVFTATDAEIAAIKAKYPRLDHFAAMVAQGERQGPTVGLEDRVYRRAVSTIAQRALNGENVDSQTDELVYIYEKVMKDTATTSYKEHAYCGLGVTLSNAFVTSFDQHDRLYREYVWYFRFQGRLTPTTGKGRQRQAEARELPSILVRGDCPGCCQYCCCCACGGKCYQLMDLCIPCYPELPSSCACRHTYSDIIPYLLADRELRALVEDDGPCGLTWDLALLPTQAPTAPGRQTMDGGGGLRVVHPAAAEVKD